MPSDTVHWIGFSKSINTKINKVTDNPEDVTCLLCKEWMKRNVDDAGKSS